MLALVWAIFAGLSLTAQLPAAERPKPGTAAFVIEALKRPANFEGGNLNDIPLFELLAKLSKEHGIAFIIMEEHFLNEQVQDIKEKKPNLAATDLKKVTLHHFLTLVLDSIRASYVIKGGRIEITTRSEADRAGRRLRPDPNEVTENTPSPPTVSLVVKGKPLKDVIASVAEDHDLSVVISSKAVAVMDTPITARLLNVPSDEILDRLVIACDLRVVVRGNSFLITTPEHAKQLAAEKMELLRNKMELERLELELEKLFMSMNRPLLVPGCGNWYLPFRLLRP